MYYQNPGSAHDTIVNFCSIYCGIFPFSISQNNIVWIKNIKIKDKIVAHEIDTFNLWYLL